MAERAATSTGPGRDGIEHAVLVTWSGLLDGDTGSPVTFHDFPDRTVQFLGTFGTGGTVQFEGSNDGANWSVLTDPQGNPIIKTGGGLEFVTETPRFVRPNVTNGDETTSMSVLMFARTPR